MGRTKEAELTAAVLTYAARCLAEGDHQALRSLNFGTREVEALRSLVLTDLERLGNVHGHCLHVALERESYWLVVGHLRRERELEDIQHALIRADAPFEMMRALFGLDSRAYTGQRSLAGVRPTVGRPPTPDEVTAHRLWDAWQERLAASDSELLLPADYLTLHQETGISPRAIWQLIQDWSATELPGRRPLAAAGPPDASTRDGETKVVSMRPGTG
jgi:hypothetical protein